MILKKIWSEKFSNECAKKKEKKSSGVVHKKLSARIKLLGGNWSGGGVVYVKKNFHGEGAYLLVLFKNH